MSKAREFVKAYLAAMVKRPREFQITKPITLSAIVTLVGDMEIRGVGIDFTLPPSEARQLAKWIIENFSEEDEE